MWGGVIVWNPPGCSTNSETMHLLGNKISHQVRGSFVNLLQLTSSCIVFLSPFLILQWGHNSFDTISFVYISLSPLCCLMVTHFYFLLFFQIEILEVHVMLYMASFPYSQESRLETDTWTFRNRTLRRFLKFSWGSCGNFLVWNPTTCISEHQEHLSF